MVEDEEDLAGALRLGLVRAGYAVDVAVDAAQAYELLLVNAYDLMLLDVNLPEEDGFAVCRAIRSGAVEVAGGRDLRVLMLTARGALGDRVRGLDEGADDYLVKPFALVELLARVRALLRRDTGGTGVVLTVGALSLDVARQEARRGVRELQLTRKEFGVLEYLMTHPGRVVPAEELLEHVWDANADPFTETVRVTVGTLRRKLTGTDTEPPIETVIGRGYRLREVAA
ncbi:response regulator transcription factor [Verrucosispora sp. SN26_14.1]|nr:response regulator transcription factor [Verrucosispora sp. SN26_14.1]